MEEVNQEMQHAEQILQTDKGHERKILGVTRCVHYMSQKIVTRNRTICKADGEQGRGTHVDILGSDQETIIGTTREKNE